MKHLLLSIALFYSLVSFGQLDFSLTPIPAMVDSTAEAEAFIAHAMIKNHSDETIVIAWQRIVNDLPSNWVSYICSNITCAPPDVSMGTFSLTANDSTNLDCYFQPEGVAGLGTVELRLFLTDDTTQVINAVYQGSAIATSTSEQVLQNQIKIYPNPASRELWLASDNVQHLEVFNVIGQRQDVNLSNGKIDIEKLPIGYYVLRLYDQDRKLQSVNRFQKTN